MTKPVSQSEAFDHNTAWQSTTTAEHYDKRRFTSLGGRLFDGMEKRAISRCLDIAERNSPIKAVLDLACGTGRISEFLAGRGYQLTCGDISDQMLEVAKRRLHAHDVRFIKADIYNVGEDAAKFDLVTAFRLFQHLTSEQRARALREMARLTKHYVLVNVMYTSAYYGAIRSLRRAMGRYTTRYTSSRTEIENELAYAGLTLVKSRLTQPGFNGDRVLLLKKRTGHE